MSISGPKTPQKRCESGTSKINFLHSIFKSSKSGLPMNLINTPMPRVSCRSPDYKDLKNAMEEVNFWSTWFTPGFLIFGRNLLQDEIVLMLIQGTIPSKAFYLLHSIIRKPGKTTCYIAISNSAFPCGSKPYVFEKVSHHLNRLPSISYLKKRGYGLTNMYTYQ